MVYILYQTRVRTRVLEYSYPSTNSTRTSSTSTSLPVRTRFILAMKQMGILSVVVGRPKG